MENEKLEWVEKHKAEILYLHKNRNNSELCKMYANEMKQIDGMISELNREFRQRIKEFMEYINKDEEFNKYNGVISKSYSHPDKNNICYMYVFELKKYQLKIDVINHMSGFSINLRTLENCTNPMDIKDRFINRLKNNNIDIIDNPKNPYTDIYHITVFEERSDIAIEKVARKFIEILKLFQ